MGMTTEEFDKKVTARLIKANDLVPALAKSMKELAAPGIGAAMNQLGITENRMLNSWKELASLFFQEGGVKDALTGLYNMLERFARSPMIKEVLLPLVERLSKLVQLAFLLMELGPAASAELGNLFGRYTSTLRDHLSPEELSKFQKQSWFNKMADNTAYSNAVMKAEMTGKPQEVKISIGVDKDEFEKVFTVTAEDVTRTSIERWGEYFTK